MKRKKENKRPTILICLLLMLIASLTFSVFNKKFDYFNSKNNNQIFSKMDIRKKHSHNDYLCGNPLNKAIGLNYNSVEADIYFLNPSYSMISHFPFRSYGTMEALYLDPLRKYRNSIIDKHFMLWVDIKFLLKSQTEAFFNQFLSYPDLFKEKKTKKEKDCISVVFTGFFIPEKELLNKYDGYCFDLDCSYPNDCSRSDWVTLKWNDLGDIDQNNGVQKERKDCSFYFESHGKDYIKFSELINQLKLDNKKVRLRGIPESSHILECISKSGVDLIDLDLD